MNEAAGSASPVSVERLPEKGSGEYHYFEPVRFQGNLPLLPYQYRCRDRVRRPIWACLLPKSHRMLAVKVILPYEETADAISSSRAILIAVAILTVFLAMITLYLIVRYVIVKPLQHLRDVSDEVSRGKMEVRAEIFTNDEFEDLAHSFNRMLRHLTDAQGELRRVNADLDGKVDELAQLNMRLYEMNRLKDDFLANMSHELRTPLNSIIGFSEVLQSIDALNDKQKRYAEQHSEIGPPAAGDDQRYSGPGQDGSRQDGSASLRVPHRYCRPGSMRYGRVVGRRQEHRPGRRRRIAVCRRSIRIKRRSSRF